MARLLQTNNQITRIKDRLISESIRFLVGHPTDQLTLLSGDILIIALNKENDRNAFASTLAKQDVHGDAILCEPEELE